MRLWLNNNKLEIDFIKLKQSVDIISPKKTTNKEKKLKILEDIKQKTEKSNPIFNKIDALIKKNSGTKIRTKSLSKNKSSVETPRNKKIKIALSPDKKSHYKQENSKIFLKEGKESNFDL